MSLKIRSAIAKQITDVFCPATTSHTNILSKAFELRKNNQRPELHLPVTKAESIISTDTGSVIEQILQIKYDDRLVKNVNLTDKSNSTKRIAFSLQNNEFVEDTLSQNGSEILEHLHGQNSQQYIVEYSSPNIAKPFHVGHLRSTIIGNFISNMYKYLGNKVHRINYLGDWGTQFGLLNVGIDLAKLTDDDIQKSPIQSLYNAYVEANKKSLTDPSIAELARKYFHDLENDNSEINKTRWEKYRKYTVDEFQTIYQRLGVEFDEYAWESQYKQKDIRQVLQQLEEKNLLLDETDGRKIVLVGDRRVPIIKSDGSTLYLARDIAAISDRFERFKFDKIIYVVDNAQTDHFVALFSTVRKAIPELEERMQHVKFGRIRGMSTRKGTVVFLKDVLDEAKEIMKLKQIKSPTTKVDMNITDDYVSDVLGISAVIINDLKQRRQRDYEFSWDRALQANGDTGIKLQYTHCRLFSLFETIALQPASEPDPALLNEPEAIDLIIEIARFPEILIRCEEQLEPCFLVNYLFALSNSTSRALKRLNVKNERSPDVQRQRLLLFSRAQKVLHDGMKILGLKPLEKM